MRRWLIFSMLLFGMVLLLHSQKLEHYDFSSSTAHNFPFINDGTSLSLPEEGTDMSDLYYTSDQGWVKWEEATRIGASAYLPLGFDFEFHGKIYDKFTVVGGSFIVLGLKDSTELLLDGNGTAFMFYDGIGVASDGEIYVGEETSISYKVEGEDGAKFFTMQFSSLAYTYEDGAGAGNGMTYQVVLLQENNSVRMNFQKMEASGFDWLRIGMRQDDEDMHFRVPVNSDWTDTEISTASGKRVEEGGFPSGVQYRWSIPGPCQTPAYAGYDFDIQVYSDKVELMPLPGELESDGLLVFVSAKPLTDWSLANIYLPENKYFSLEDPSLVFDNVNLAADSAYVMCSGSHSQYEDLRSPFELKGLVPNTEYYIYAAVYNDRCVGGPLYSMFKETKIKTLTMAPASLDVTMCGEAEIHLSAQANALNEDILVVETVEQGQDNVGNYILAGKFAYPSESSYKVGDTVKFEDGSYGGTVVYVGAAPEDDIMLKGRQSNTIYHYAAYSQTEDGVYSSVYAQADTITGAVVPFDENFKGMPAFSNPYGWEAEGESVWNVNRPGLEDACGISLVVDPATDKPLVHSLTTPAIRFPEKKDVRMIFSYSMKSYKSRFDNSLLRSDWTDSDSILFQVSTDGVVFETFYAMTKQNADDFVKGGETFEKMFSIKGYAGKVAYVRIKYISSFKFNTYLDVNYIKLIEIPDCDYPLSVSIVDGSIVADQVEVSWVPGVSEESYWHLAYALVDEEGVASEWIEEEVSENPYLLGGLEGNSQYQVRVRAMCGVGLYSDWTYSSIFNSGYTIPMQEDFNELPMESSGWMKMAVLPSGWEEKPVYMSDSTDLSLIENENGWAEIEFKEWKTGNAYMPGYVNGAIMYSLKYSYPDWILLPQLDFGPTGGDRFLSFDISFTDASSGEPVTSVPDTSKLCVVASYDNGKTYRMKDTLYVMTDDEMGVAGDSSRVQIDLSKLSGPVRLAFYLQAGMAEQSDVNLFIDNIVVGENCHSVENLQVLTLGDTFAMFAWDTVPGIGSYRAIVSSSTDSDTLIVDECKVLFSELTARTEYSLTIDYLCGENWSNPTGMEFLTGGDNCEEITNLEYANVTKNSVELSWDGNSDSYQLRIRVVGEESVSPWYYYESQVDSFLFDGNLSPATSYEAGVKSLCSDMPGDTSDFSPSVFFTTASLTCFAPTELKTAEITHNSIGLQWKGSSEAYEVSYKKTSEDQYIVISETIEDTACEVTGLEPETGYMFRVRSVCGENDYSTWSEALTAYTIEIPRCEAPKGLQVDSITTTSAILSWEAAETNDYILRYRMAAATSWDSIVDIEELSYKLVDLQESTAYVWSVMCICSADRLSGWASQSSFETLEDVATELGTASEMKVLTSLYQLHVLNPTGIVVDRVEIFNRVGSLLETYSIGSDGNVYIRTSIEKQPVVVRVISKEGKVAMFKVMMP